MLGYGFLGGTLLLRGDIAEARAHLDQGVPLYDPAEHRPLAKRFGEAPRVNNLYFRSYSLWLLGYPETARADIDQALKDARERPRSLSVMGAQ